jgi:hypothetical protein
MVSPVLLKDQKNEKSFFVAPESLRCPAGQAFPLLNETRSAGLTQTVIPLNAPRLEPEKAPAFDSADHIGLIFSLGVSTFDPAQLFTSNF